MISRKRKLIISFLFIIVIASHVFAEEKEKQPATIKFGHASGETSSIIRKKYSLLLSLMSESLECEINFIHKKTYEEVQKAFIDREIDMGILNAFSFINVMNTPGLVPVASRVKENSKNYKSYFIVRNDSHIKKLSDLKGSVFAFQDIYSTSAYLVPRYHLKENNIDPERDFGRVVHIPKQDSVIFAVLNRTIDAGAVASFIFNEQNESIKSRIRVFEESLPFPLGPFVANASIGEETIEKTRKFLFNLEKTEVGRAALSLAELDSFTEIDISDYDYLVKIINDKKSWPRPD